MKNVKFVDEYMESEEIEEEKTDFIQGKQTTSNKDGYHDFTENQPSAEPKEFDISLKNDNS